MPLSTHDEMSAKGAGVLLVELSFKIGLLIGTFENDWSLPACTDNVLVFLTVCAISVSNSHRFTKSLQHESSHVLEKTHKKGLMLRKALNEVAPVTGD